MEDYTMSLLKRKSNVPSLFSSFFESDPFFNTDWISSRYLASQVPSANISESNGEFQVELAVPGMNKDDFEVTCDNGLLTISAEKEEERKKEDKNYTRREYNYSSFSRSFTLPESVKSEEVRAKYENGVLKVMVPKTEAAKKQARKEIKIS
jgi:HSP20 family protein